MPTRSFMVVAGLTLLVGAGGCNSKERRGCERARDWYLANGVEPDMGDAGELMVRALDEHFVDVCMDDERVRLCAAEVAETEEFLDHPCVVVFEDAFHGALVREMEHLNADIPAPT